MREDRDGRIRTFVAVWLDEPVRRCVEAFAAGLRTLVERAVGSVRWVNPAHYHFTLRFLGDLDGDQRERVFEAVAGACRGIGPFVIRLGALGAFPDLKRPRVLWIGVEPPADRMLARLAEEVERALGERGFAPADRPFAPHLTIGRVAQPPARAPRETPLAAYAGRSLARECGSAEVREVVVMASRLTPAGPIYTPLMTAPLDGRPEVP